MDSYTKNGPNPHRSRTVLFPSLFISRHFGQPQCVDDDAGGSTDNGTSNNHGNFDNYDCN